MELVWESGAERRRERIDGFLRSVEEWLSEHVRLISSRTLQHRMEVADILQEVRLNAWRYSRRFSGTTPEEFFLWVRPIARNTVLNLARCESRLKRMPSTQLLDLEETMAVEIPAPGTHDPHESLVEQEEAELLDALLETLSESRREVLQAIYYHNQTVVEVAERLMLSPDTVRKRMRRDLRQLRGQL